MNLKTLITTTGIILSTNGFSALYTADNAVDALNGITFQKKAITGFTCDVTKKYVSEVKIKKDWTGKVIGHIPHTSSTTLSKIVCNVAEGTSVEHIRTTSDQIGSLDLEYDRIDTQLLTLGKSGKNPNTGDKNQPRAILVCDGQGVSMVATYDRMNETIESAFYSSKHGTKGDTLKLYDIKANHLPVVKWASVNLLTDCKPTTK